MIVVQLSYTLLYFITEASFNHGMNPHVYVTYRHMVAGILLFPFAYFIERYVHVWLTNIIENFSDLYLRWTLIPLHSSAEKQGQS